MDTPTQSPVAHPPADAPIGKYPISVAMREDLKRRFSYHRPKADQPVRYVALRERARELAGLIVNLTPICREQSLALTKLEEAIFFANAAIARNE